MNTESRIQELFAEAVKKPSPVERQGFLDEVCRGKPELRSQLDSLLKAHDEAGAFLKPTLRVPQPDIQIEPTGAMIGRYKLLEKIGEGGFGIVYMAEQVEPVQRKVALKVIKAGMDTREVVARFEAERQALALMDHPNIAKVLDAGATQTGRPYFVMELVRGIPITDYCDQKNLATAERLSLFIKVCHAVQHAHQKGIIHRDIKPSNVLVTLHDGEPVPKVIDFGVAKALGQKLTEKTLYTGFTQMIGTPAYMSPEQATFSGLDIDTRSDIYSLGVLLYELLTGVTPFDKETLAKAALDEMRRIIRETEPPKPSTRLETLGEKLPEVARHRHIEPMALRRLMRGDLDWIVLRALEKDRARRYETANALALDVKRHLDHEPVSAAAPSAGYQLRKLLRRHRVAAAWGASFALLLVVTAVVSTLLAVYAQQQRDRAENAESVTRDNLYAADMGLAKQALDGSGLSRAQELLRAYISKPGEQDRRGVDWRYLWALCRGNRLAGLPLAGEGAINGLCLTPDDRFLIAATGSGNLCAIRFEDFKVVCRTNVFREGECAALAMSADGRLLAVSGEGSREVVIWSLSPDGQLALVRSIPSSDPYGLAFSPGARRLAVGTGVRSWMGDLHEGGITRIISVDTGETLGTLPESGGRAVAWSPDGRWIATGPRRGWNLKVWSAESFELKQTVSIRTPNWAQFSSDSQFLLVGNGFRQATRYHLPDLRVAATLATPSRVGHGNILAGALSANGRLTAIGLGNRISLEDAQTRNVKELVGHEGVVRSLAFSHDGAFLVSGDGRGKLMLWSADPAAGPSRLEIRTDEHRSLPLPPSSPDGERIAFRSGSMVYVVHAKSGKIDPIPTPSFPLAFRDDQTLITIRGLSFLEAHNRLLPNWRVTNQPPFLEFWDLVNLTNRSVELTAAGSRQIMAMTIAPNCEQVALAVQQGDNAFGVLVLATASGDVRFSISGLDHTVYGLAFAPDDRKLAVTSLDGKVRLYAPPEGKPFLTLQVAGDVAVCPAFSAGGAYLAVGGDRSITVWSLPDGREWASFVGQLSSIHDVRFSANGKTLIGYGWGTTKLWHLPTKRELFALNSDEPRNLIPLTAERYAAVELRLDSRSEDNYWEVVELPPLIQAEEWMSAQATNLAESRRPAHAYPPRDPKTPANLINLDPHYCADLDHNWHGGMPGNDLRPLPRGVQVFGSTSFDVRGLVLPDRSGPNAIRVERECRRLRFLHNATGHGIKPGNVVGQYVIHYADGQSARVPLITGRNIQDWWETPESLAPDGGAEVAWVGSNTPSRSSQRTIHLLTLTWENPRPEVSVRAVDFLRAGGAAQPFLVALTIE